MIGRIFAYILIGLGFLTITYFRKYSGEFFSQPFLFWLSGVAMIAGGFLLSRYTFTVKSIKSGKVLEEIINNLKTHGEQVKVDLGSCEIREHNYIQKIENPEQREEQSMVNIESLLRSSVGLSGLTMDNEVQVQVNQSVIIFSRVNPRTGKTEKFVSRVIPKDKVTLSFYLDQQKHTTLYIDKSNPGQYYFDLDFLYMQQ